MVKKCKSKKIKKVKSREVREQEINEIKTKLSELGLSEEFEGIKDFPNISVGLAEIGFSADEIADIMGLNWLRFYEQNFGALAKGNTTS